ncbi:MAG: hypothetical protein GY937_02025 [bacterium]|nr:hypothetical protein [bacterium]
MPSTLASGLREGFTPAHDQAFPLRGGLVFALGHLTDVIEAASALWRSCSD